MTITESPVIKKRHRIAELRKKHEALFVKECLSKPARFIPKMVDLIDEEKVIMFYPSEVNNKEDIYIECVDIDNKPKGLRTLYKWPFNSHYDTEYTQAKDLDTGHTLYIVPVEELLSVESLHRAPKVEAPKKVESNNIQLKLNVDEKIEEKEEVKDEVVEDLSNLEDSPLSEKTMRDELAIAWMEPISKKEWLNKLLIEYKK